MPITLRGHAERHFQHALHLRVSNRTNPDSRRFRLEERMLSVRFSGKVEGGHVSRIGGAPFGAGPSRPTALSIGRTASMWQQAGRIVCTERSSAAPPNGHGRLAPVAPERSSPRTARRRSLAAGTRSSPTASALGVVLTVGHALGPKDLPSFYRCLLCPRRPKAQQRANTVSLLVTMHSHPLFFSNCHASPGVFLRCE